ncbi:DUF932 domain-containing protein [Vibrio sp. Hal054]|uniref:DUF932 domain-containing protein n=1 Tax=Vibrio sp. Hal054 TaxID=3035158 RepID=UPI00301DF781
MNNIVLSRETSRLDFNAIANRNNWRDLCLDDRTNSDIFFDVQLTPLADLLNKRTEDALVVGNEKENPFILTTNGEQAVIDLENNHIIAVHGKDYTLIRNELAYSMINEAINKLAYAGTLNTDGMFIKDSVVNKGGKTIREYIFPEHKFSINADDTLMKITVINSYDGSSQFSIKVGGFRVVCLNGLVAGNNFQNLTKRHSGEVNLVDIENRITTSIASFKTMGEYWEHLIKTPISTAEVDSVLTAFCTRKGSKPSAAKFNMLDELYRGHSKTTGKNWWSLYNTLTAWSTHYEVQERNIHNKAEVILRREREVEDLLHSNVWTPVFKK